MNYRQKARRRHRKRIMGRAHRTMPVLDRIHAVQALQRLAAAAERATQAARVLSSRLEDAMRASRERLQIIDDPHPRCT